MNRYQWPALAGVVVALSGCATVENFAVDHPVATTVGVGIVAGVAVAALDRHHHRETHNNELTPACGPPTAVLRYPGGPTC